LVEVPMIEPLPNRQQNYVSQSIQGSLLRQFGRYWLLYLGLLWHGMFMLNVLGFPNAPPEDSSLPLWEQYGKFSRAHSHLAICAMAILPLFYWNLLRLTHRIAGPLERFRQALERLQRGEPVKPVTLRRDDLLIDYQRAFNRYLAFLEQDKQKRDGYPKEPEALAEPASSHRLHELESLKEAT
jgi:hypothetical protein